MIQNQEEDGNKKMCCISRHIWIDKKTKLRFKFAGSLQAEGNSIRRVTGYSGFSEKEVVCYLRRINENVEIINISQKTSRIIILLG